MSLHTSRLILGPVANDRANLQCDLCTKYLLLYRCTNAMTTFVSTSWAGDAYVCHAYNFVIHAVDPKPGEMKGLCTR